MQLVETVGESGGGQRPVAHESLWSVCLKLGDPVVVNPEASPAQLSVLAQLETVPDRLDAVEDLFRVVLVLENLADPSRWIVGAREHVFVTHPPALDVVEAVYQ